MTSKYLDAVFFGENLNQIEHAVFSFIDKSRIEMLQMLQNADELSRFTQLDPAAFDITYCLLHDAFLNVGMLELRLELQNLEVLQQVALP